jgi:hypothetical protein
MCWGQAPFYVCFCHASEATSVRVVAHRNAVLRDDDTFALKLIVFK